MKLRLLLLVVLLLAAISAFGQVPEGPEIPIGPTSNSGRPALFAGQIPLTATGSAWSELGTISPIEKNNLISTTGVTQSVDIFSRSIFSLTPYIAGGATFDTRGYVWNNELQASSGARINAVVPHGLVSVGVAIAFDDRFRQHATAAGRTDYVQDWFGWQLPATDKRYPGSTWATYGVISPIEKHNRTLYGYVQQGVVAGHIGTSRNPIVLFAELTGARDSQHFDWNNFYRPGAGIKVVLAHGFEFGSTYSHEERYLSKERASGVSIFVKFDTDWTLLGGGR